jgi:subtilisin family serine protease
VRRALAGAAAAVTFGAALVGSPVGTAGATSHPANGAAATEYVVLYAEGASPAAARAAIAAAGGSLMKENVKVGYALVRSTDTSFRDRVATSSALEGAARNRPVGYVPKPSRPSREAVERLTAERALAGTKAAPTAQQAAPAQGAEPLADRQWDMRQIGATATGSYRVQPGRPGVMVGIIDTGLDAQHPDIRPNFNRDLSRNFTTDIPSIDGPCEFRSCHDPVGWDDNGHGTHLGSTVAGAVNGIGIAGVAPNVTLVNLRAGQDSGYFFLDPTLDAYTYAGDIGVDVINMSYFTDPWLFNCLDNPKDSPAEQREQRVIRRATQRAIDYAIARGVTPVAAEGNEATDLGHPKIDEISPDFPAGSEKTRRIDNSCITVPTETRGVIAVSATGISTRKAYYSNYGTEQTDVAAPGGDYYDSPDNTGDPRNLVLAAYPERLGRLSGEIDKRGNSTTPFVVKDCLQRNTHRVCAYYQYLQGTSMASPHAAGVAALIVSQFGHQDAVHGGLTMAVDQVRHVLYQSAVEHACPQPRLFHYKRIRDDGSIGRETAFCAGPTSDNGFYGHGIVNAYAAVKFGS